MAFSTAAKTYISLVLCLSLHSIEIAAQESNEDYAEHLAIARFKKGKAEINMYFAGCEAEDNELIKKAENEIVKFRKGLFSNFDSSKKGVDACIWNILKPIETNPSLKLINCKQDTAYKKLMDEILEKFSVKTIKEKAEAECIKDLEKAEGKEIFDCIKKTSEKILADSGFDPSDLKKKLESINGKVKTCTAKVLKAYKDAQEQVGKCPKS